MKCLGDDPGAVLASEPPDGIDALREVARREHLLEEHVWIDSSSPDFDELPECVAAAEQRSAVRFRRGLQATRVLG